MASLPFEHGFSKSFRKSSHREQIKELFQQRCAYCGRASGRLTLDHVLARSKGGSSHLGNLLPACHRCNLHKGSRRLVEWYTPALPYFSQTGLKQIMNHWQTVVPTSAIRYEIARLRQATSEPEQRDPLLALGLLSGILSAQEGEQIGGDPRRLSSEQQQRIWDWVHRWEAKRDGARPDERSGDD